MSRAVFCRTILAQAPRAILLLAICMIDCSAQRNLPRYVPAVRVASEATFAVMGSARVVQAAMHYPEKDEQQVQELPMALTGSDGSGLSLVALDARAVVQGPLAFTELHLTFHNPEPRVREGRFTITLPSGAAVSRLAMQLPHGWQEAEVVERKQAQRVYEDFLHRKQDPALLEKKAGNQFDARIFPIAPRSNKELIISYSQKLADTREPYRIHLKGLPTIESLQINARIVEGAAPSAGAQERLRGADKVIKVSQHNVAPEQDFEVLPSAALHGLQSGNLALVRVAPRLSTARASMNELLVLVDTSASRAAGFYAQTVKLQQLLDELKRIYGDRLVVQLACFDQEVSPIFRGSLSDVRQQDLDAILARRPLGASDLSRALRWAKQHAQGADRLLLVSDGVATAGETEPAALVTLTKALANQVQRIDALVVGGIRDEQALQLLVRGTTEQDGVLLDGAEPADRLALRLSQTTLSGIQVTVPGARWSSPAHLDGVQPGDQALVFADLGGTAQSAGKPLQVVLGGPLAQTHTVAMAAVERPLVERAWSEARIDELQQQQASETLSPAQKDALSKQIVELSTRHRVLSDVTALLLLESDTDYARYGIQRTALGDILVVGERGVETAQRRSAALIPREVQQQAPTEPPKPAADRGQQQPFRMTPPVAEPGQQPPASPPGRLHDDAESLQAPSPASAAGRVDAAPSPSTVEEAPKRKERAAGKPMLAHGKRSLAAPLAKRPSPAKAAMSPVRPPAASAALDRESVPSLPRAAGSGQGGQSHGQPAPAQQAPAQQTPAQQVPAQQTPAQQAPAQQTPVLPPPPEGPPPLAGKLAEVMALVKAQHVEQALLDALRWRAEQPGDVMAIIALGAALEAGGQLALAARVYGSIIDLFPSRADMRRFAGERLEALGLHGLELAADTFAAAVKQRPDHALGHHLLGFALLRLERGDQALDAIEAGLTQTYPIARRGVDQILREDFGLVAAAVLARHPGRQKELEQRLAKRGATIAREPSLRFVLTWQTDANDVDFHIFDGQGGHASFRSYALPSGGSLYADVTNGYGPECFTINGIPKAFPYTLRIHYYSRGPMGYGMGTLQLVEHKGHGQFRFEDRPFVVMNDRAYVELGTIQGPL